MEIEFLCLQDGRRYHRVRRHGRDLFVGTHGECERFLALHREKAEAERESLLRERRPEPFSPRVRRVARVRA